LTNKLNVENQKVKILKIMKRIKNYRLEKLIGFGNYSKVKIGIDEETNEAYAIKIIQKEKNNTKLEYQHRMEICIMKLVNHENIVKLKEVVETEKEIFIVMELVTGGELFDKIINEKYFTEETARRYFQQLICGRKKFLIEKLSIVMNLELLTEI
jgi:serine/threonine protein kinase